MGESKKFARPKPFRDAHPTPHYNHQTMRNPVNSGDSRVSRSAALIAVIVSSLLAFFLGANVKNKMAGINAAPSSAPEMQSGSDTGVRRRPQVNFKVPTRDFPQVEQQKEEIEYASTRQHIQDTSDKENQDYIPFFQSHGLDARQIATIVEAQKKLHGRSSVVNDSMIALDVRCNGFLDHHWVRWWS
jgi:hypothetical protein